jgi:hypothetical protein
MADDCETALQAALLADASPAAAEWVVTGRWPAPATRVEIQWPAVDTKGVAL